MREFKFRAWDKENKKMLYDGFVLNPDGSIGTVNNDDQWKGLIVMQYTGINDIHGTRIYESDIIHNRLHQRIDIPYIGLVGYEDGIGTYLIDYVNSFRDFNVITIYNGKPDQTITVLDGGDMEVIGNLYENPKLQTGEHIYKRPLI